MDIIKLSKDFICSLCQESSALDNYNNPNYIGCAFRHIDNSYCDKCITYSHFISFLLLKGEFINADYN